jgi:hypothetical protein
MFVHCVLASAHVRFVAVNNMKHDAPDVIFMSPPVHGRGGGASIAASGARGESVAPSIAFGPPPICTPQPASNARSTANRIDGIVPKFLPADHSMLAARRVGTQSATFSPT